MTVLKKDFVYFLLILKVCRLLQFEDRHIGKFDNKNHPTLLGQGGDKTTI